MNAKAFEIRDSATFIPAVAVRMVPEDPNSQPDGQAPSNEPEREAYLLRRAGFGLNSPPLVLLARMDANGGTRQASYDPFGWGCARTMQVAQEYIAAHWDELQSGAVICVEHILGERDTPKPSEQEREP